MRDTSILPLCSDIDYPLLVSEQGLWRKVSLVDQAEDTAVRLGDGQAEKGARVIARPAIGKS